MSVMNALDLADFLTGVFTEPDRAIGSADHTEGVVDLRRRGRSAVAAEARDAGAGKGLNVPIRGRGGKGKQGKKGPEEAHATFQRQKPKLASVGFRGNR
jgi:hypothetical protein